MQIKKGFFLHEIGKETIVMHDGSDNINFCNVISLNPTAAFLWRQIEGRAFTSEELIGLLTEHYEVDEDTARRDTEAVITSLRKAGLLAEE